MSKIIHYRNKCIGCAVCYQMQPDFWRMSRKDGKAVLLHAICKKEVYILAISEVFMQRSMEVAEACPVNIIKVQ